jgi:hypothetical protein
VFQVTTGIQTTTWTLLLVVQVAYNADAEVMLLMLVFHQAVALVVNRHLIEHEIVEFHMYLADHQGQTRSLVVLFLKRNKSRRSSTKPPKESFPKGDQVGRRQFRRLLRLQDPFANQTQLTENEELGKTRLLGRLIQTIGQTLKSTEL